MSWYDDLVKYDPSNALNSSNMGLPTNSVSVGMQSPGYLQQFGDWFDNSGFLQQRDMNGATSGGWGTPALGVASGLTNAWLGFQQYGLAKDTLQASKEQFKLNFGAQQKTTNNQIASVNAARAASREGASNPYKPMELV